MHKQIHINVGEQYKAVETDQILLIKTIGTGKDPVITYKYYEKEATSSIHMNDAKRLVDFKRWIKVKI